MLRLNNHSVIGNRDPVVSGLVIVFLHICLASWSGTRSIKGPDWSNAIHSVHPIEARGIVSKPQGSDGSRIRLKDWHGERTNHS